MLVWRCASPSSISLPKKMIELSSAVKPSPF